MRWLKQLEFVFQRSTIHLRAGRDVDLELQARGLLRQFSADKIAREIRVEWNPRMRSAAGRADFREKLIWLNPLLRDLVAVSTRPTFGCTNGAIRDSRIETESCMGMVTDEIDRTLRHELAHLLAQFRV